MLTKIDALYDDLNAALLEAQEAFVMRYGDSVGQIEFSFEQKGASILAFLVFEKRRLWVEQNGKKKQPAVSSSKQARIACTDVIQELATILERKNTTRKAPAS